MAIRLMVAANDPEVEGLLAYLQAQPRLPVNRQISLLERAVKWLEASDMAHFRCDPSLPHSSHLSIQPPGLPSAPSASTPFQHRA